MTDDDKTLRLVTSATADYVTLECGHKVERGTGYAELNCQARINGKELQAGDRFCHACDRELTLELVRSGEPVLAYVKAGSEYPTPIWTVTTWGGEHLGRVIRRNQHQMTTKGGARKYYTIRVEISGWPYFGRTEGPGTYVNLRRAKNYLGQ